MSRRKSKEQLNHDDTEICLAILAKIPLQKAIKVFVEEKQNRTAAEDYLKKFNKSRGKNSAHAKAKQNEGNEKFKKNQYSESLRLYTESIFSANKGEECLPLAYANRSSVLFKMNYLTESLVDVDMALECGYPKSNLEKLLLRKEKCLSALAEAEKAKNFFTETSPGDLKEIQNFMANKLLNYKGVTNKSVSSPEENLPKLTGGENENFISASKYVSVHYNETRGRHVVANTDIKPGDVLFVEKPFACVLREDGCHNCFKKTIAPIPCWDCLDVSYCSPKCREEFTKSTHAFECGFSNLLKSLGISHLSLRTLLSASSCLDDLKQNLKKVSIPEIKNGIVLWNDRDYNRVYNLLHHSDQHDELDSVLYAKASLILATYLKNSTNYFPATGNDEDLLIVTSVIWLHIFQSVCNGFIISRALTFEERAITDSISKESICGTGIYPSASIMNHSCHPSTVQSYVGSWMVVRATRAIEKGSEVFGCYGPESTKMDRASRQEKLRGQYFFHCECSDCLLKVDVHDIFTAFKCTNCKGPSVMDAENSENTVCVNCGSTQEATELLHKRNKFYTLIQDDLVEDEYFLIRLKRYLAGWKLGREILYKFHKDLGLVADQQLSQLLMDIGECKRAIMFLKCSVRSVEVRFGSFSIELADELLKLGCVYSVSLYGCKDIEIRKLIAKDVHWDRKAYEIMTTLHGPNYEGLREIQKYKMLLMCSTFK